MGNFCFPSIKTKMRITEWESCTLASFRDAIHPGNVGNTLEHPESDPCEMSVAFPETFFYGTHRFWHLDLFFPFSVFLRARKPSTAKIWFLQDFALYRIRLCIFSVYRRSRSLILTASPLPRKLRKLRNRIRTFPAHLHFLACCPFLRRMLTLFWVNSLVLSDKMKVNYVWSAGCKIKR